MKKASSIFILVMIVVIAVFDVFVIIKGGTEASISHTIYVWSHNYPAFTFLTGFTMGHLFWRLRDTPATREISDNTRK